jgi:hypothetical protein
MVLSGGEISYLSAEYIGEPTEPTRSRHGLLAAQFVDWLRRYLPRWQGALVLIAALLAFVTIIGWIRQLDEQGLLALVAGLAR